MWTKEDLKNIFGFLALFLAAISINSCETGGGDINVLTCETPLSICSNLSNADTIENYANWIIDDCDGGGINNELECENGTDFNDPTDDCQAAVREKLDLCALIMENGGESHVLAFEDCDGGGIDNISECRMGLNPIKDNDIDELNFMQNDAAILEYLISKNYLNIPDSVSLLDTVGVVGQVPEEIDLIRTASGLIYFIETPGNDTFAIAEDSISYHMTGYFLDESTFDSTADSGPRLTEVRDLIAGLQEAMLLFPEGSSGTVIVPSYLAYGSNVPGDILTEPYTVLLFDIELLDIL